MTRFEDMAYEELKAELADWTQKALMYSREYRSAVKSGEEDWEHNMGVAVDDALDRVRRIERMIRNGVAA